MFFMLQADFGGTDGTGNFTAEYPASIGYPDLVNDATGKGGSAINHCHQDSPNFQAGIQLPLYPHHCFEKLLQALLREGSGLVPIITLLAAVSALMVSIPRDGIQSTMA